MDAACFAAGRMRYAVTYVAVTVGVAITVQLLAPLSPHPTFRRSRSSQPRAVRQPRPELNVVWPSSTVSRTAHNCRLNIDGTRRSVYNMVRIVLRIGSSHGESFMRIVA